MLNYLKLKKEKTSDPLAKAQSEFTNEKNSSERNRLLL